MLQSICELVREAEDNYLHGTTQLGEYVNWSMHDTIETIDAYLNSKHISGQTDSLGREKPFFNIVTAVTNIWYRATDLDRKDIKIMPDKTTNTGLAFIATVHLQQWMKREKFGTFLNQWGRTLAKYGSAIVKFVEQDGRLIPSVVPWNRFIADPVQFDAIPRIEKFYMTPAQLRKMSNYDQDLVEDLIETAAASRKTLDGFQKDNQNNFIEVYEVHGELDSALLEDDADEANQQYVQQMHVVSFVEVKGGEWKDYTLYRGRESRDPYMITHLIEEDGRTLAIGAVESLFDAQWMVNHSIKNTKDTLDLASKLIFQTADSRFVGRNVLTMIETGNILIHSDEKPLTRLANDKPDIQAFVSFGQQWSNLAADISSTPDVVRGDNLPSGTPYSLGALQSQNAGSLFEQMTENKGLHLEDMLRTFVLPFLKKKMDTKDEIVATLHAEGITEIDAMYVPGEAVRRYNSRVLDEAMASLDNPDAPLPMPFNQGLEEQGVRNNLAQMGNKRSFAPDEINEKTWKEALKDFEWTVEVQITNEMADKQAVLQTLSTALQTIGSNPQILQDQNARMLFSAILTETGRISPLQLASASAQPAQPMAAPAAQALNQLPANA